MIELRNVDEIRKELNGKYDEIWLIVRSPKNLEDLLEKDSVKYVPALSPSRALLDMYLEKRSLNEWDEACFLRGYLPWFQEETCTSTEFLQAIADLKKLEEQGKRIALVCFCEEEQLCHRSIVGAYCKDKEGMDVYGKCEMEEYIEKYFRK